jgi:hypothetical protein
LDDKTQDLDHDLDTINDKIALLDEVKEEIENIGIGSKDNKDEISKEK